MKRTPLYDCHKQLGARMVLFGGWEMPVLYSAITEEHLAVRKNAGLFDICHMGEIEIRGPGALALVQRLTCNDASRLQPGQARFGQAQYSAFLTPDGTFIDDIIIYRRATDCFLICVNASNSDKDVAWVRENAAGVTVEDKSSEYSLLALQGPKTQEILDRVGKNLFPARPFAFLEIDLASRPVLIARTGYTGETGVEIYCRPQETAPLWSLLLEVGKPLGLLPCGLGARDTLRIEAALPLYGHEIDDHTNPFEAGLGWIVKMNKGDFIGREALIRTTDRLPLPRQLVGLQTLGGIARENYAIHPSGNAEESIGRVTSGTWSPLLDRPIALGYVKKDYSRPQTKIQIDIRGKKREAIVVSLPFYKRT